MMAGNLGRHYYKKPIAALTFAEINLRLGNFAVLMANDVGVFVKHSRDIGGTKLI